MLKITGPKLGKVSYEGFSKLLAKAEEVLNQTDEEERSEETKELQANVAFLKQAEELIRAIDPTTRGRWLCPTGHGRVEELHRCGW